MYIQAFDEMMQKRFENGKKDFDGNGVWIDGQSVFQWWIGDLKKYDANQIRIEEIL